MICELKWSGRHSVITYLLVRHVLETPVDMFDSSNVDEAPASRQPQAAGAAVATSENQLFYYLLASNRRISHKSVS